MLATMMRDDVKHFFKMQILFGIIMTIYQLFFATTYGDLVINGPMFYVLLTTIFILDTAASIYLDYKSKQKQKKESQS